MLMTAAPSLAPSPHRSRHLAGVLRMHMLLAVSALHFPPSPPNPNTRVRGIAPRGNAVVRYHSRERKPPQPPPVANSAQLRSEALASYGLNINDHILRTETTERSTISRPTSHACGIKPCTSSERPRLAISSRSPTAYSQFKD